MRNNGVTRPAQGTMSRVVWDATDGLAGATGSTPTYPEVYRAVKPYGLKKGLVDRAVMYWRKFHGVSVGYGPVGAKRLPVPGSDAVYLKGL